MNFLDIFLFISSILYENETETTMIEVDSIKIE